ncbi:hypothetical protein [Azotobacter chroococcum]|uniref:hypothetical protein n=1 Tax=Azotobacter chroococcum TaxID=353 RepID=UPI00058492F0|nr:hypothetical protein [Azotobacter chroococcum]
MLHHNPVTDSLEAVLCLAFSGLQGVCRLCISPIPMHKVSAAPEPLEATPLLGWRRSAGLCDLYIPGKPGMTASQSGAVLRFEVGKPGINADWRKSAKGVSETETPGTAKTPHASHL